MSVSSSASEPFEKNGEGDGQDGARVCVCGVGNTPTANACWKCGRFVSGNAAALKTGVYARTPPADVVMTADQMLSGLLSDKGGAEMMTTLEREIAAQLRSTKILCTLNLNAIVADGMRSPESKKAHDRYLAALDRFMRLATLLGLDRRAKNVSEPIEAALAREPEAR